MKWQTASTLPGGETASYSYDNFERTSSALYPTSMLNYSYETDSTTKETSNRVPSYLFWARFPESGMSSYQYTIGYTYDANGNITEIKKNNSSYLLYEYDSLGQLTRESSYLTLNYDRYTYDDAGNRLSKNTYYWSGTLKSGETYGYTNSTWGDLLTNYNGTSITYDASGNPLNWKGMLFVDWRGNRLTNLYFDTPDAEGIFFEYNADGIRTQKMYADRAGEVPVYTDVYTVDGSKILSEQRTDEETGNVIRTIYYVYDANGLPVGMKYNGVQYWYQKNMQGDVVRILNEGGAEVAIYTYDAWGKNLQITDKDGNDVSGNPDHIANINPFRYRGYYYDVETGWYYLNARYYDPNVGRFLSPDTILGANGGLQGYNLFAYCNNNPVMFADPSGQSIVVLTGGIGAFGLGSLIAIGAYAIATVVTDVIVTGVEMIRDWNDSDNEVEDVSPTSPAPTIDDIKKDLETSSDRHAFTTIFSMPDIAFEIDGNIAVFEPTSPETPTIMIKKAGNTGSKGRPNEKNKGAKGRKKRKVIKIGIQTQIKSL